MLEFAGDGGALDDFLQAGGVDVVLDLHPVRGAVLVDVPEPVADAVEEFDVRPVAVEVTAGQLDPVLLRLVVHQFHVGEDVGGVLPPGDAVALGPELLGRLVDGLDETEFLHVAGRQGSVEIVDERDDGFSPHRSDFTAQR